MSVRAAEWDELHVAVRDGRLDAVKAFIETHGGSIGGIDCSSDLLSAAIALIDFRVLEDLDAQPDKVTVERAVRESRAMFDVLIAAGAAVDGPVSRELPPLHVAVQLPSATIVSELIRLGADPSRVVPGGGTAYDLAVYEVPAAYLRSLARG